MGDEGINIIKRMKKDLRKANGKIKIRTVYDAKKLGSKFTVKDKTKMEHQHNVTYYTTCGNTQCESDYVGETGRRILVRTIEHNKRDKKSHLLKHAKTTRHRRVWLHDVKIIGSGYKSKFKRRISEALHIKTIKPDLNVQKDAYKLSLYN